MNYDKVLVLAKQLVCSSRIDRIITPAGVIYQPSQWDGVVKFTVKAVKDEVIVLNNKGTVLSKSPIKKVKPEKKGKKEAPKSEKSE